MGLAQRGQITEEVVLVTDEVLGLVDLVLLLGGWEVALFEDVVLRVKRRKEAETPLLFGIVLLHDHC